MQTAAAAGAGGLISLLLPLLHLMLLLNTPERGCVTSHPRTAQRCNSREAFSGMHCCSHSPPAQAAQASWLFHQWLLLISHAMHLLCHNPRNVSAEILT